MDTKWLDFGLGPNPDFYTRVSDWSRAINDWVEWKAEFRGFFWADGTIGVFQYPRTYQTKAGPVKTRYLSAHVVIAQRDDNEAVLRDIQAHLGGTIYNGARAIMDSPLNGERYVRAPQRVWRQARQDGVRQILAILRDVKMPYRGLATLDLIDEFLNLPRPRGAHLPEATKKRMWEIHAELKRMKLYAPPI